MAYGYDADLLNRMMPRIRQWETTMGRKMPATMYESIMRGAFGAEADKGVKQRALDLQERSVSNQEEAYKDQASAAKTKGYIDTGSTLLTGGLAYKAITKPSAMSEYIAYMKGTGPGTPSEIPSIGAFAAPNAEAAGYGLSVPGSTAPAFTGAQTTLGGGTTAVGGQAALAGSAEIGSLAAYDAALAEGAAAGVGSTAGATTLGAATTAAGYAALGYTAGDFVARGIDKWSPIGGQKEKSIAGNTAKGAGAGAGIGVALGGPPGAAVGAVIGGVIGFGVGLVEDVSVICSELLRQGRITQKERVACVVFRFRFIPGDMFDAYLEWAEPIVKLMRGGGLANALLLPFAHAFVNYMTAIQAGKKPTFSERMVWKYAWWRCSRIARKQGAMMLAEVA